MDRSKSKTKVDFCLFTFGLVHSLYYTGLPQKPGKPGKTWKTALLGQNTWKTWKMALISGKRNIKTWNINIFSLHQIMLLMQKNDHTKLYN